MPGGLPLGHEPLQRVTDRAAVLGGRQRLALGDQRLLALDGRGALARSLGVGPVALLVERLTRGGAIVSEKHCNFLINTGSATAADLEGLGEEVRRRVFEQFGVTLEWEIRRIGVPAGGVKEASA